MLYWRAVKLQVEMCWERLDLATQAADSLRPEGTLSCLPPSSFPAPLPRPASPDPFLATSSDLMHYTDNLENKYGYPTRLINQSGHWIETFIGLD